MSDNEIASKIHAMSDNDLHIAMTQLMRDDSATAERVMILLAALDNDTYDLDDNDY